MSPDYLSIELFPVPVEVPFVSPVLPLVLVPLGLETSEVTRKLEEYT